MSIQTIKTPETRKLFTNPKTLMPKKEVLLSIQEICKALKKPLSNEVVERSYQIQLANAVISGLRKQFQENHCLFISYKVKGSPVKHGFTSDTDKITNYRSRVHSAVVSYKALEKNVNQLQIEMIELLQLEGIAE